MRNNDVIFHAVLYFHVYLRCEKILIFEDVKSYI